MELTVDRVEVESKLGGSEAKLNSHNWAEGFFFFEFLF